MVAVCGGGVSAMAAVCGGASAVVGALDGGGDSFGLNEGRCWVHCSSYESGEGCFLGVGSLGWGCGVVEASKRP